MSKEHVQPEQSIANFLDESDLINIYAEWLAKNRSTDPHIQNGFLFEIISKKYLQNKEPSSKSLQPLREILMFLLESENQRRIWGENRSAPDDLFLKYKSHTVDIHKIIECKISAHAAKGSFHQKESSKNTVRAMIGILNGDYHEIKDEKGKKIISDAREKFNRVCHLPLNLPTNYKYVYALPSGEEYVSFHPKDANLEVINLPFSIHEIENFRKSFFGFATELEL